ncbi:MAG: hypothetical protein CMM46_01115 [Rhodospirillaceae bacterium]|nr:hypothetical protein [Rhodospirillaceae bacterium]
MFRDHISRIRSATNHSFHVNFFAHDEPPADGDAGPTMRAYLQALWDETGLGMTDARLWRYAGVPAFVYGSTTEGTAGLNENVEISDYLHVVKTHALTVLDRLSA